VVATQAAREYANLLSQEMRGAAPQQGLAQQDQFTNNGGLVVNEIGCSIMASIEWKKYVVDVASRVIAVRKGRLGSTIEIGVKGTFVSQVQGRGQFPKHGGFLYTSAYPEIESINSHHQ